MQTRQTLPGGEHIPAAYSVVYQYLTRSYADGIIVFSRQPEQIIHGWPEASNFFVVKEALPLFYDKRALVKLPNVHFLSLPQLNGQADNKILLVEDYFGRKRTKLRIFSKLLVIAAQTNVAFFLNQPVAKDSSSFTMDTWKRFFSQTNDTYLFGRAAAKSSAQKDTLLAIGGKLVNTPAIVFPPVKVLAVITAFNEVDIIEWVVRHLLREGLAVHVVDNWSSDGTFETIKALAQSNKKVSYERFPEKDAGKYEWGKLLARVTAIANERGFDWIMHNDADEIRSAPWPDMTLAQAIAFVDYLGYNSVDFTVFDFRPTKDGFTRSDNPGIFFKYGEFGARPGHFVQVKLWKHHEQANLQESGGHQVALPNQKIFPLKFFLGHYSLRSSKQSIEKIFKGRKARFIGSERKKGWHVQYDKIGQDTNFIYDRRSLIHYDKNFMENYLLERISGCGINRED